LRDLLNELVAKGSQENTKCYGNMIRKAVVPAAGLGTRLLTATKEQPKEMLPIFSADDGGLLCLKPMVQQIFEQLFDFGIREFYFVVGRGKRAIQDHFTPDRPFVQRLSAQAKNRQVQQLESFYKRVDDSTIVWVNQPDPKGFGDAVLHAERLVDGKHFLVHAGDTYIISRRETIAARLTQAQAKGHAAATLTLKNVKDPRQYGVANVSKADKETLEVKKVVEKPSKPTSKLAIMPVYIFSPIIFDALRMTPREKGGELQLTDSIQKLIETGHKVQAIKLRPNDVRLDIGTPENYREALELSYRNVSAGK